MACFVVSTKGSNVFFMVLVIFARASTTLSRYSCLLCMAAMADHLNLTEDEICETAQVITRWATYLDEKILSINEVAEIIKNKTGIEFGGF